jgi:hypothetical protein
VRNLFEAPFHLRWSNQNQVSDLELLRAWNNGLDTKDIAQKFHLREAEVCARLWRTREAERAAER